MCLAGSFVLFCVLFLGLQDLPSVNWYCMRVDLVLAILSVRLTEAGHSAVYAHDDGRMGLWRMGCFVHSCTAAVCVM